MKNYTIHFLILTLVTTAIGFTGLEFAGAAFVRVLAMIFGIALMLSCLDAVLVSKRMRRMEIKNRNAQRK